MHFERLKFVLCSSPNTLVV